MRLAILLSLTLISTGAYAQESETSRKVADGGITAPGWTGKVDAGRDNDLGNLADLHFNFALRNSEKDVLGNIAL